MITKKTYIKAAKMVHDKRIEARSTYNPKDGGQRVYEENVATELEDAFIELFRGDNPRFDEDRFSAACSPDVESLV
jgi:hypothetical protein